MEAFIGQIELFPYDFAPMGWLKCQGQLLNIQQNQALYSLLGIKFGGNPSTNFCIPNLLGAEPIPGMAYYIAIEGIYPQRP